MDHCRARSKRTLGLDLKNETGRTILRQLVRSADVFITNQSPASRSRLGISYEQLSQINPRLVYAALTGYGETAPKLKDRDSMPTPIGLDRDWPTTCDPTARVLPHHLLWGWAISQRPSLSTQGSSRRFFTGSARAWEAASRLAACQRSLVECGIDPGSPVRWRDPIPPAAEVDPERLDVLLSVR